MNLAPKISVIIPVFNSTDYLEQCIYSVLNQTLYDLEIIAINDGSTDDSGIVLDNLAQPDQRLRVFHVPNRGVSAARNFGIDQAKGEYLGFADADDWMEPAMLETLYNEMKDNTCDWAICNVKMQRENTSLQKRLELQDTQLTIAEDRSQFLQQMMQFKYDYANWNKLFRSSIIQQHHLRFEESMYTWEDLLFNLQYLHYVNKVALVSQAMYNYRVTANSLYHKGAGRLHQFNCLYKKYIEWSAAGNWPEREAFRKEIGRLMYYHHLHALEKMVREKNKHFVALWRDYAKELAFFDRGVFYFPASEKRSVQWFKRLLLSRGQFSLYALAFALKSSFARLAGVGCEIRT
jgi:glycosyltransferase involved in cell wall biosynthesis